MKREHPNLRMSMPISMGIFKQLGLAAVRTAFRHEDWEIAEMAIREWMGPAAACIHMGFGRVSASCSPVRSEQR